MKRLLAIVLCFTFILVGAASLSAEEWAGPVWKGAQEGWIAEGHINIFETDDRNKWRAVDVKPCPSGNRDQHMLVVNLDKTAEIKFIEVVVTPTQQDGSVIVLGYSYFFEGYIWFFRNVNERKAYKFMHKKKFEIPTKQPLPPTKKPRPTAPAGSSAV